MSTQLFLLPALYFVAADADRLAVRADPAPAAIPAQANGRRLLQLPDLEFRLRITTRCTAGRRAESLSISIADTRKTLSGDSLPPATEIETSMRIEARQLAPLALRSFCVAGGDSGRTLLVPAALTAQASLRCADDDTESIVYASESLDVSIRCEPEPESTEASP